MSDSIHPLVIPRSHRRRGISNAILRVATAYLRRGGLFVYPTETAYAIGCDATNARAVAAIFRLKGRERRKPLPLIVASRAMAERYAQFTPLARRLAKRYWPGPLTLVLRSSRHSEGGSRGISHHGQAIALAPGIIAANGTVAIRVSAHPVARALSRRLGRPIVSTSANRSGDPPAFSIRAAARAFSHARNTLPLKVGNGGDVLMVNAGTLPRRKPSTIVDARGSEPIILRQGAVSLRGSRATEAIPANM